MIYIKKFFNEQNSILKYRIITMQKCNFLPSPDIIKFKGEKKKKTND